MPKRKESNPESAMERLNPSPSSKAEAYERHRLRAAARQRMLSAEGAEIGPLPEVQNPERKKACRMNLKLYLETYHAATFYHPWSPAQLDLIRRCERSVLHGGLCAVAYPRGEGKSSIIECAAIWALLYGHHRYVFILKSTDDKFADESLDSIRTELDSNELLLADFPEVCYPIVKLQGSATRANKQTLNGKRTHLGWKGKKRIIFPTVPGSPASGAVLGGSGLTARGIRGSRFKRRLEDGQVETLRPTLVIADDVQDDETASNPEQTGKLKRLINGALLGMAGPDGQISVLFPCTIIQPGDLADELTDREKSPEWKGLRMPLLLSWPEAMERWEEWNEIRRRELRGNEDLENKLADPAPKSTEFLKQHFDEMHRGAEVLNKYRKLPWQLSALQQAMTLYFRDPISFWSEYMNWITDRPNSPNPPNQAAELRLDAYHLARKSSGYPRGTFASDIRWLTCFLDVQHRVIYWMVCGWQSDFTGSIVDYGTWPETRRERFSASTFRPTLREKYLGQSQEGALASGLTELTADLLSRDWRREDGVEMQIERCMIDAGDQTSTIKRWLAASPLKSRLLHSFGRDIGPNDWPMEHWKLRPGEVRGEDWVLRPPAKGNRTVRHVIFNTYHWKTFVATRLAVPAGEPGSLTLPAGRNGEAVAHEHLAAHLTAEQPFLTHGQRQSCYVWRPRPGVTENHWWDCLVGNAVLASMLGARLETNRSRDRPVARQQQRIQSPAQTRGSPLAMPDGRPFFITARD